MTRDNVLEEFRSDACECDCEAGDCIADRAMADEIVRLRRILAALREPSDGIWEAAAEALDAIDGTVKDAIRAAVAAAEREVGA